jgi:hypothetical protein
MNDSSSRDRRSPAARPLRRLGLALFWLLASWPVSADPSPDARATANAISPAHTGQALAAPRVGQTEV